MSKIILVYNLLFCLAVSGYSQNYFANTYDPFDHGLEDVRDIRIIEDVIYLFGSGLCDNNKIDCHKLTQLNLNGELIEAVEFNQPDSGLNPEVNNNYYYVGGDDGVLNSTMFLLKAGLNGDSIQLIDLKIEGDRYCEYYQYGTVEFNDQIIVYGQITDKEDLSLDDGEPKIKIVMFWVNKDMTLDTLTFLEPPLDFMVAYDMVVSTDDHLLISAKHNGIYLDEFKTDFLSIYKMNKEKEITWSWTSPPSGLSFGLTKIVELDNGNIVFNYIETDEGNSTIWCINPSGEVLWTYEFERVDGRYTRAFNISKSNNGDILGCGSSSSVYLNYGESAMAFRITPNGELLWQKVYLKNIGGDPLVPYHWPIRTWFNDIQEMPNGDIIAAGSAYSYYNDPELGPRYDFDLYVVKTDADGCLDVADCSFEQEIGGNPLAPLLVDTLNLWTVKMDREETGIKSLRYKISPDSVYMDDRFYQEVLISESSSGDEFYGSGIYLRERERIVWMHDGEKESTLYAFNMNTNAVFRTDILDRWDTGLKVYSTEEGIDIGGGRVGKKLEIRCTNDFEAEEYAARTWIEGIGDLGGLFSHIYSCQDGYNDALLCHYYDGELTYTSDDDCWQEPISYPFVTSEHQWIKTSFGAFNGIYESKKYTFDYDSEPISFNDKSYYEVLESKEQTGENWTSTEKYFAQDGNQVYELIDGSIEKLQYDFDLQLLDKFEINNFGWFIDTITLVKIDSIQLFDNSFRKRYKFVTTPDVDQDTTTWIEGIGNIRGPFLNPSERFLSATEYTDYISCYFVNDNLEYSVDDMCWRTSTDELTLGDEIKIYPNPVLDVLQVSISSNVSGQIKIYDMLGGIKQMHTIENGKPSTEIDVSALATGTYIVEYVSDDRKERLVYNQKFVKI